MSFKFIKIYLTLFCAIVGFFGFSQELDMTVLVIAPNNLTGTDKAMFPKMELAIKELANSTKWTNDNFELNERIKCKFQLTVRNDNGNNSFDCDLIVEASRPIYGSNLESTLFSISEKNIPIIYDPTRALENNKDIYTEQRQALLTPKTRAID